ncbi:hypothetical protein QFC21_004827 [Naganishia friedmannii]|uniref:Uncharacterized protein n=1 Tax=Naganishia friedmannii TaxID=89922 RepID=A0ACC2VDK8_9TREE|nr:hypothetical protein QFC21_004827 [Naganishia friedmannii]
MRVPFLHPKPAGPTNRHEKVIPEYTANIFDKVTFGWIYPLLKTGYTRPLEEKDVWRLDDDRLTKTLSDQLEHNFYIRCPPSRRPAHLGGIVHSSVHSYTSDHNAATETKIADSVSAGTQVNVDAKAPKLATYAEGAPEDPEKSSDTERDHEDVAPVGDWSGSLPGTACKPTSPKDHPPYTKLTGGSSNTQGANLATSAKIPQVRPSSHPSFITRVNPWAIYRKLAQVGRGKLDAEPDDQGHLRSYDSSLVMAIWKTTWKRLVLAMLFKAGQSTLETTSSLVTKQLIAFITTSHAWDKLGEPERASGTVKPPLSVGHGLGLAIGLAAMQEVASLLGNHYYLQSFGCGFMMRSALINQIARKSLRLSPKSRIEFPNGKQITAISTDASYAEWCFPLLVQAVVEPFAIVLGFILLILNLGPSALVGIGVLAVSAPFIASLTHGLVTTRQQQLKMVDRRVRLTTEILNAIRQIKLYAYESYFSKRVLDCRDQELARVRERMRIRATLQMVMTLLPTLAAVLSFMTYSLAGNELTTATIFASLQLFNVIQFPMQVLPTVFSFLTDGHVAIGRISKILKAEELPHEIIVRTEQENAIDATGDFAFEIADSPDHGDKQGSSRNIEQEIPEENDGPECAVPTIAFHPTADNRKQLGPFTLNDIDLHVPRGSLVCIFGQIGSGKSALLQALIGEMKQTCGLVTFGSNVSLVTQIPWIQNASVRDNILFGQSLDAGRLERVIQACALSRDLYNLSDGIDTEIGERGINLSGGQRSRIALARAAYSDAEVILMDDPLSAVDSHGEYFYSGFGGWTRILVTHHLEAARHADLVLVMENGRIVQQGSYRTLSYAGTFQKLLQEPDSVASGKDEETLPHHRYEETEKSSKEEKALGRLPTKIHLDEERNTGALSWRVYAAYFNAMSADGYLLIALASLILAQCSQLGTTLFLGFWSASAIPGFNKGHYMGIYAGLGISLVVFTFVGAYSTCLAGIRASFLMFRKALRGVLRSPISFHDRTPTGRIISRLAKDVESSDDRLAFQWHQLLTQVMSVFGLVALVFYTFPLLGIFFGPMIMCYATLSTFFRRTSRELKRIDSTTRSFIFSNFGEQLVGTSSIRTFGQQERFLENTSNAIDYEFRFYYASMVTLRWLSVRLDLLGNCLVLCTAIFGVCLRNDVAPAKFSVVMIYALQSTQTLSQLITMFALVEQEMNTCERILFYGDLPVESEPIKQDDPSVDWPSQGIITFDNVVLKYRPELPAVLKGLSFTVQAGEKIGIVGRTGAGKSSCLQAVLRLVELHEGRILVDGMNISEIGLDTLRHALSAIPQEALLFSGTMRDNLDPEGIKTDAALHDALQRCSLLSRDYKDDARLHKFKLEAEVADDGSNFSGGERQLVALCRALVRNRQVLILDEATSSVDPETDAIIQKTIRNEFKHITLQVFASSSGFFFLLGAKSWLSLGCALHTGLPQ